jgi:GNAT superfamily N-acetyltransferase
MDARFAPLDLSGLRILVDWARREGWNPGPHDAEAFFATDPEGFYGYWLDGELAGGGSLVSYGGAFGFMGFFIMKPEYRGQGWGRKLWLLRRDRLLERLRPGASIGMDGVVAMQPFYQRGGFEIAFRDERHVTLGREFAPDPRVEPLTAGDFDDVAAYDRGCFGFDRAHFLRHWLAIPGMRGFLFRRGSRLQGMALLRPAMAGYKICPLFADDAEAASALYRACLGAGAGAQVILDVPAANPAALAMVRDLQTERVFECARMYHGQPPPLPLSRIYGLTSFELG